MTQAPKNKITFTVKQEGKPDFTLAVIRPSVKVQQEAQMVYAKAFADYAKAGALLKTKLDAFVREQKIWDDAKQAEYERLIANITANEKVVKGEVKNTTLTKGKEAAIQMRKDRNEVRRLTADRVSLETNTVEGQAENSRFNFLVAACTVFPDTKKPYFANADDFMTREDDPATFTATSHFAQLYYGYDEDTEKGLPENQFLLKWNIVDDKLNFINKEGKRVDSEGRLIDENGRFINEKGEFVDRDGKRVTESGDPVGVETYPFLDEAGLPLAEPAAAA